MNNVVLYKYYSVVVPGKKDIFPLPCVIVHPIAWAIIVIVYSPLPVYQREAPTGSLLYCELLLLLPGPRLGAKLS